MQIRNLFALQDVEHQLSWESIICPRCAMSIFRPRYCGYRRYCSTFTGIVGTLGIEASGGRCSITLRYFMFCKPPTLSSSSTCFTAALPPWGRASRLFPSTRHSICLATASCESCVASLDIRSCLATVREGIHRITFEEHRSKNTAK